jgi:hypothetical protein
MTITNTAKARNTAAQAALKAKAKERTAANKAKAKERTARQLEKAKIAKAKLAAKAKEEKAIERQKAARLAALAKKEADRIAVLTAPLPAMHILRKEYVTARAKEEAAREEGESRVARFCQGMRRVDSDWLRLARLSAKEARDLQHNEAAAYKAVKAEKDAVKIAALERGLSNEHKPWSDALIFEEKWMANEAERAAKIAAAIAGGKTLEEAEQEADATGNGASDKPKLTAKQRLERDLGKVYQAAFKLAGEEPNDKDLTKAMDALKAAASALHLRIGQLEAATQA